MKELVGIIYPTPDSLVGRIKKRNKFSFTKNPTHEVLPKRLEMGDKILFYNKKHIIAGRIISSIVLMSFESLFKIKDIIQTKEELKTYCGSGLRKFKKQIVYKVEGVKSYDTPLLCPFTITMVGQYIKSKDYKKLIN